MHEKYISYIAKLGLYSGIQFFLFLIQNIDLEYCLGRGSNMYPQSMF